MFGVLEEVLGLDCISTHGRFLGHRGIALVVVAGVLRRMALIASWTDARRPLESRTIALRF
jgi:hypothetical protein